MAFLPVEWVLVIYYGPSAHRATYGRLNRRDTKYTKDYIQLSKKEEFVEEIYSLFSESVNDSGAVPLTYKWPTGSALGDLVFKSADRPHLKWETNLGAPQVWKMSLAPNDTTAETIPGDPSHLDFAGAENELALIEGRGAGQPYLLAIKLQGEPQTLQLRVYLKNPADEYSWAGSSLLPSQIQNLIENTSRRSALAWARINSGGEAPSRAVSNVISRMSNGENYVSAIDELSVEEARQVAAWLRNPGYGLFFDPDRNHDAWSETLPISDELAMSINNALEVLDENFPVLPQGDAAAETLEVSGEVVELFRNQIEHQNYEVPDYRATVRTRGSAQRAFSEAVKNNYGRRCALTGIQRLEFLVASHIVPWSEDQRIRLDPSNGICLSLLVDRAFETGYLIVGDDLTVHIDWNKVGNDQALRQQLEAYEGRKLDVPTNGAPRLEYLQRRRALVT
ncbi:HNH endonuclease [Achromobacter xylosoxidans]